MLQICSWSCRFSANVRRSWPLPLCGLQYKHPPLRFLGLRRLWFIVTFLSPSVAKFNPAHFAALMLSRLRQIVAGLHPHPYLSTATKYPALSALLLADDYLLQFRNRGMSHVMR